MGMKQKEYKGGQSLDLWCMQCILKNTIQVEATVVTFT